MGMSDDEGGEKSEEGEVRKFVVGLSQRLSQIVVRFS